MAKTITYPVTKYTRPYSAPNETVQVMVSGEEEKFLRDNKIQLSMEELNPNARHFFVMYNARGTENRILEELEHLSMNPETLSQAVTAIVEKLKPLV